MACGGAWLAAWSRASWLDGGLLSRAALGSGSGVLLSLPAASSRSSPAKSPPSRCAAAAASTADSSSTADVAPAPSRPVFGLQHFVKVEGGKPAGIGLVVPLAGRAWQAVELRRKSFHDLQSIWLACVREQNYLHSLQLDRNVFPRKNMRKVKQTMARIKQALTERALDSSNAVERELALDRINAP